MKLIEVSIDSLTFDIRGHFLIPFYVIQKLGIKENVPFIVKDFSKDREIGCYVVRDICNCGNLLYSVEKESINHENIQ